MSTKGQTLPHVVILGGGFAGLYAARRLRRAQVQVTLLDRRNHHLFQPLLYQVATAVLNPSDIAAPIRSIVTGKRQQVLLAEATSIDAANKKVILTDGELSYDYLVVATGATHSYFGRDDWESLAPGLKSIEDALEIRRRVLLSYEAAEREQNPEVRKALMTFVIVGAGPTGVELAGALAEIARHTLPQEFRRIDPSQARIILVEGLNDVLAVYPKPLPDKARQALSGLGVEVRTGARVTGIDEEGVLLGDERLNAKTVLWAAGVAASPLAKSLGAPLDRVGRVKVTADLSVPGHNDIFVVGDLAYIEQDGKPIPGVAPAAMQMGKHAAQNILRHLKGQPFKPFRYWDRGAFAVIGRGEAVGVMFRKLKMTGVLAWLAWLFIHIFFLIGFRNRAIVLLNWVYSYATLRRGARLITGEVPLFSRVAPPAPKVEPPNSKNLG